MKVGSRCPRKVSTGSSPSPAISGQSTAKRLSATWLNRALSHFFRFSRLSGRKNVGKNASRGYNPGPMPVLRWFLLASVLISLATASLAQGPDPSPPEPASHALDVVGHELPATFDIGDTLVVTVQLRNQGTATWRAEERYSASSHWFFSDGKVRDYEGPRTPIPGPVATGQVVSVDLVVKVPAEPGVYLLQWDVVQDHVCWISRRDPTPAERLRIVVRESHAFTVGESKIPGWMGVDGQTTVELVLQNDGNTTWPEGGTCNLSYHWLTSDGKTAVREGLRTPMPTTVYPGESTTVAAILRAPPTSGPFLLQWDMVDEGVCWFTQTDTTPAIEQPVRVVPVRILWLIGLATVTLLLAGATVVVSRRNPAAREWVIGTFALADLLWIAPSLLSKEWLAFALTDLHPTSRAAWVIAGGPLAVLLLLLVLPRRIRPWCTWAAAAAVALLLTADVVYFRYFGDLIAVATFDAAGQTGDVGESIWALLKAEDLGLWIDLLPGLALAIAVARLQATRPPGSALGRARLVLAGLALLLSIPAGVTMGRALFASKGPFTQVFRNAFVARELGMINFHVHDLATHLHRSLFRPRLDDQEFAEVVDWFRQRRPQRDGRGPWFGAAHFKNLLMVQVESWQRFVVGLQVNGQEVTPNINRWLEADPPNGIFWFPHISDQTHHGRSSDCELSTQVSLLPLSSGAAAFRYAKNDFTGLAEILAQHGYHTLSTVAFKGSFWNRQHAHPAYGYAKSLFADFFAPGENIGWGLSDRDFLAQMVTELKDTQRPFCAFLITLSLHHPFIGFPEHHKKLDVGKWEGTPFGNYVHTMHFFDSALASFTAALAAEGMLEDTMIVLWGDHDAGLGWEWEMAQAIDGRWHVLDWYLTERVPLIIRLPGRPQAGGEMAIAGGQTDIAPTVLGLLGIDPAPYAFLGRNLLGAPGDEAVVGAQQSWLDSKYLFRPEGTTLDEGECYDLATRQKVAIAECAAGYQAARRQQEISRQVLVHDLQQRIHDLLAAEQGPFMLPYSP